MDERVEGVGWSRDIERFRIWDFRKLQGSSRVDRVKPNRRRVFRRQGLSYRKGHFKVCFVEVQSTTCWSIHGRGRAQDYRRILGVSSRSVSTHPLLSSIVCMWPWTSNLRPWSALEGH